MFTLCVTLNVRDFKGATKLYFKHYSCVVIILFNTGLYNSAFFTYSFGKLVFWISALFVFFVCKLYKLYKPYNVCIIIVCIVGVR